MSDWRRELTDYGLEVLIYFALVVIYFFGVLTLLGEPLGDLYRTDLTQYFALGFLVLVGQGVLLEFVTSQIIKRVRRR